MYEELYAQNEGLLFTMANQYAHACELDRAASVEDLVQAGFLGLVRAVQTHDAAAGRSWGSWAVWNILNEFNNLLGMRQWRRAHTGAVTLDRPLSDDGGETLGDMLMDRSLPDADAGLLRDELRQGVREAVDRLADARQRRVTQLCHLEGRDFRDTAREMGISVAQTYQLAAKARSNLAHDWRLRALIDLDERTRFHAHKGVAAFNSDWTSVTEAAVLWRMEQMSGARETDRGDPAQP